MIELSYSAAAFLLGLALLVWSADRFVDGSVNLAQSLKVPPLLIGLTIVSLGTSAPEILVSIQASLEGSGDLAIGNAVGSNIANIGLVLGATALLFRVPLREFTLGLELVVLITATGLGGWFLWDATLDYSESAALLLLTPVVLLMFALVKRQSLSQSPLEQSTLTLSASLFWLLMGLVLMVISSRMLVWGATQFAIYFGVSPLLVGLTAVAVGTSLPELAASLASAWRGQHGIALGNILGSNIFNLLVVMAIPGMLQPLQLDADEIHRNYAVMVCLTLLLGAFIIGHRHGTTHLGRVVGLIFLLSYAAYYYWLFELDLNL